MIIGLLALPLLFIGCDDEPTSTTDTDEGPDHVLRWEKSLNSNANNWLTDETSGPKGWCGDITHYNTEGGPVSPSSGSGYATAEHGQCNDYWQDQNFPSSGPYAFYGALGSHFPANGFIQDLDIYLDPSWSAGPNGSVFTYVNSFRLLDGEYPNNLRYIFIPVTKQNGNLQVMGENISEKGWYTFRFSYDIQDNNLAVTFELQNDDETIFTTDINQTSQTKEQISSFEAGNIGNGYAWFLAIKPGLELPVDEQEKYWKE